ncbi:MAG: signal peptidase I, partial [bacterium]
MKKKIWILSLILIATVALTRLWWLVAGFTVLMIFHIVFTARFFRENKTRKQVKSAVTVAFIFLLAIAFRLFFIEIYSIPSGSMEETLLPGDKVLVNKLVYGAKLPASPYDIPWVNLFWYLRANATTNTDSVYWAYDRMKGFSNLKRGDVMVFSHPLWGGRDNYFIKRCVALPGDTLKITNGLVQINGSPVVETKNIKKRYQVWTNKPEDLYGLADSLGINASGTFIRTKAEEPFELLLSTVAKNMLLQAGIVDSVKLKTVIKDSIHRVYPKDELFYWTIDDYGPLIIPYKGMTIQLDDTTYKLYRRTIQRIEQIDLQKKEGG